MSNILANLEPARVFHYFEEICNIPHGSKNTKQISNYIVEFAKKHSLQYRQDEMDNVIIWKPGVGSRTVMLQGHMDMVAVKDENVPKNLETDGLDLIVSEDTITADGTSLGADDGIAVAYALAILESDDIIHPNIEAVFTVDEEIGMNGAAALDCSDLKSTYLLNLDLDDDRMVYAGCAGGATVTTRLPVERERVSGIFSRISISGATGGHSGTEIIHESANSASLLGRLLYELREKVVFQLTDVCGGEKDNSICLRASAGIVLESYESLEKLKEELVSVSGAICSAYKTTDPNLSIKIGEESDYSGEAFTRESTEKAVSLLFSTPNGVVKMDPDLKGLVQTSLNLGILRADEDVQILSFTRSSVDSEKFALIKRIQCNANLHGASVEVTGIQPAWEYNPNSPLCKIVADIYREEFGHEATIGTIHAGVECGIFTDKIKGLDAISLGPNMADIHTTKETLEIKSTGKTWKFLLKILEKLASC